MANLVLNSSNYGEISYTGEVDDWSVVLTAGQTYTFSLEANTLSDPYLTLLDSNYYYIVSNDDGGEGLNSLITYTPLTSGTYILQAEDYWGSTGDYYLLSSSSTSGATASSLSVGSSVAASIDASYEVDTYTISLTAGQTYVISMEGNTLSDSYVTLLDASGNYVTSDDDSGEGWDALITYTPTQSQTFTIEASAYSNYTGSYNLSASIAAATPQVTLSASSTTVQEGNSGSTPVTFTLQRSGDTSYASSIGYYVDSYSMGSDDFAGGYMPSGVVDFAVGETTKTVTINVAGDTDIESDESFSLSIYDIANASIATSYQTVTVQNDDSASAQASLSITAQNAELTEGNSGDRAFTFTVERSGSTTGTSSAQWSVSANGTNAANVTDFGGAFPSGTVTFAAGETSKTITVNVSGDTTFENDEIFTVTLSNPQGATLGASGVSQSLSDYASGGYGVTESYYSISGTGSDFTLDYEMYSIPDRADIYVNNVLAASTYGEVSNSGTLSVTNTLVANDIVKVVLTGTDTNTAWDYSVNYSGGVQSLDYMANGVILNDDSNATTLPPSVSTNSTNAKVFLASGGDYFNIATSGTTLYAASGDDTVQIQSGITNVTLDGNLETLALTGNSSDYMFAQAGNRLKIYSSSQDLIATTTPQGDSDGLQIVFADGTISAKIQSGVMYLGSAVVTTTISPLSPYSSSTQSVTTDGTSDASAANITYTISANDTYKYTISGFGAGDVLDFPSSGAPTVDNKSYTDGTVDLLFADYTTGQVATITLTGVSNDMYLNSIADFNAAFGAGTIA